MKWKTIAGVGVGVSMVFGATADVVAVPDGYYVREAPANKAQFTKVDRKHDLKGLTEAHIIGSACYDQFVDPTGKLEKKRERITCEEYWNRANIPYYPAPKIEGYVWSSYVTHLFDTPTGDMEEGYYAKSDDIVEISAAQFLLEQTPVAEAAISLDAVSEQTADSTAVTSLSWTHTIGASASTTVLVVGITMGDGTDSDRTVNALTFNGDSLFKVREDDENTDNVSTAIWQLPDPDLGALTITATLNNSNLVADGGSLSIHGVDHYTPVDAQASSAAANPPISAQVTTVAGNSWVLGVATVITGTSNTYSVSQGTVEIGTFSDVNGDLVSGYFGPQVSAGLASTTWTCSGVGCAGNDWISSQLSFDPNCSAEGDICSQLWRASGTWVAPANLTSVDVACWGGGGGGGVVFNDGGGGGGGGAFASSTITVTGGNSYAVVIGTGGASDTISTTATSSFNGTSVVAAGGYGTTGSAAGLGGLAAVSTGTVTANGGNGGTGSATLNGGGGGGGVGGPHGAGGVGGNGSSSGGAGGAGDNGIGGAGGVGGGSSSPPGIGGTSLNGGGGGGGTYSSRSDPGANAGVIGAGGGGTSGNGSSGGVGAPGACLLVWTYPAAAPAAGGIIDNLIIWFTED